MKFIKKLITFHFFVHLTSDKLNLALSYSSVGRSSVIVVKQCQTCFSGVISRISNLYKNTFFSCQFAVSGRHTCALPSTGGVVCTGKSICTKNKHEINNIYIFTLFLADFFCFWKVSTPSNLFERGKKFRCDNLHYFVFLWKKK